MGKLTPQQGEMAEKYCAEKLGVEIY